MEEQNRSRGRGDSGSSCRLGLWARFREHGVRREGCWREDFWVLLCSRQVFLAHHFLHKVHQICKLPFSWLFMLVSEGGVVKPLKWSTYLNQRGLPNQRWKPPNLYQGLVVLQTTFKGRSHSQSFLHACQVSWSPSLSAWDSDPSPMYEATVFELINCKLY